VGVGVGSGVADGADALLAALVLGVGDGVPVHPVTSTASATAQLTIRDDGRSTGAL